MALYVVIGPPASGKSTYVTTHATPGAVVIDLDRIATALTAGPADSHRHPKHVMRVAQRGRRAAIREALKLAGDHDVWVVHTDPSPDSMAEYTAHRAKVITLDPGRDVVLARCAEQRTPGARAAAVRWYQARTPDGDHATQQQTNAQVTGSRAW